MTVTNLRLLKVSALALAALTATALEASPIGPDGARIPAAQADTPLFQNVQIGPGFCTRIGRRVFFENCWWQRIRCPGVVGPQRDRLTCLTCPDLPGRRCPRGT